MGFLPPYGTETQLTGAISWRGFLDQFLAHALPEQHGSMRRIVIRKDVGPFLDLPPGRLDVNPRLAPPSWTALRVRQRVGPGERLNALYMML